MAGKGRSNGAAGGGGVVKSEEAARKDYLAQEAALDGVLERDATLFEGMVQAGADEVPISQSIQRGRDAWTESRILDIGGERLSANATPREREAALNRATERLVRLTGVSDIPVDRIHVDYTYIKNPDTGRNERHLGVGMYDKERYIGLSISGGKQNRTLHYQTFVPDMTRGDIPAGVSKQLAPRMLAMAERLGISKIVIPLAAGRGGNLPGGPRGGVHSLVGYRQWMQMGATPTGWAGKWNGAALSALARGVAVRFPNGTVRNVRPEVVRAALGSGPKQWNSFSPQQVARHPVLNAIWSQYGSGGKMTIDVKSPEVRQTFRHSIKMSMARAREHFNYGMPKPWEFE